MDVERQVDQAPPQPDNTAHEVHELRSWKRRGGTMLITDDGEFQSSIVQESVRTYNSRMRAFLTGRQNIYNLGEGDDKFCVATDVVKAGYLDKRGSWFTKYKRRYFVLRADKAMLTYFDSEKSIRHTLGAIHLSENTSVEEISSPGDGGARFEFVVRTPEFTRLEMGTGSKEITEKPTEIMLRAETAEERTLWVEDILGRCASMNEQHKQAERRGMTDWWEILFEDNNLEINLGSNTQRRNGLVESGKLPANAETAESASSSSEWSGEAAKEETGDGRNGEAEACSAYSSPSCGGDACLSWSGSTKDDAFATDLVAELSVGGEYTEGGAGKGKEAEEEEEEHEDLTLKHIQIESKEDERDLLKYTHARKSSSEAKFKHPKDSKLLQAPLTVCTLEAYSFRKGMRGSSEAGAGARARATSAAAVPADRTSSTYIGGFQICLDLRHLVFNNERLFAVVFGKKRSASFNKVEGLHELSRTELIEVRGGLTYGVAIPRCQVAFTLLQMKVPDDVEHLVVSVWNADQVNGSTQQSLSSSLCYKGFRAKHMQNKNVFSTAMKINVDTMPGTNEDIIKSAHLGIVQIQSSLLREAGMFMRSFMPANPYTETMSAYRTLQGYALCAEQIFASSYGVISSIGLLKFLIDEKEPILDILLATSELESENSRTRSQDKKRESRVSRGASQASLKMYSEHLGDALGVSEDLLVEEQLAATMTYGQIYDEGICDLEAILYMYMNATAGASALDSNQNIQNVVSEEKGGGLLRRSSWKKASLWQYVTTNLNVHLLISKVLSDDEVIKDYEKASDLNDDSVIISPVITLGVPAAHGLKFSKGGLRRIFIEAGFVDASSRCFWMHTIQNAQKSMRDLLVIATERDELSKFAKLVGIPRDYIIGGSSNGARTLLETDEVNPFVMHEKRRFLLAKRVEICLSQILGFACTLIHTVIQMAALQPRSRYMDILHLSLKTGFLLPLQSLLSTQGDELGMIEDMDAAVLFLRDVKMKVMRKVHDDHKTRRGVRITRGEDGRMVVSLYLGVKEADLVESITKSWADIDTANEQSGQSTPLSYNATKSNIPQTTASTSESKKAVPGLEKKKFVDLFAEGEIANVNLVSVFMNQGVNEWQSIAGNFGSKSVNLQVKCNQENLDILRDYIAAYQENYLLLTAHRGQPQGPSKRFIAQLTSALNDVSQAVEANRNAPNRKHVTILTTFAFLCRNLCGTVGILCKSGKDRTGMSSTLELVRSLTEEVVLIQPDLAVQALRETGGRRMNVWANTGQSMFAFNSLQRSYLPACYRPPAHTYSANVAS